MRTIAICDPSVCQLSVPHDFAVQKHGWTDEGLETLGGPEKIVLDGRQFDAALLGLIVVQTP